MVVLKYFFIISVSLISKIQCIDRQNINNLQNVYDKNLCISQLNNFKHELINGRDWAIRGSMMNLILQIFSNLLIRA